MLITPRKYGKRRNSRISTSNCTCSGITPYTGSVSKEERLLCTSFQPFWLFLASRSLHHYSLSAPTNLLTTQFHFPPFIQFLLSFILETPQFSSNCMPACFSLLRLESFPCLDLPNTFAYSLQRSLSFFFPPHGPSYLSVCDIESLLYSNLLLAAHPTKTTTAELKHTVILI